MAIPTSHDPPVAHGALDHAELAALGLRAEDLLDFSSNINPFGPPEGVRRALAALDPAPYPDRSCSRLRQALAHRHGCAPAQVLAGNGSNELIHLVARALLGPGATALVVGPTFGEYAYASRLAGARLAEWRAGEESGFRVNSAAVIAAIGSCRPQLTWICAPNNPTGADLTPAELAEIAAACARAGGHLVLDRAYYTLRPTGDPVHDELDAPPPPGLLRLHSLTKSYALAGLRVGYLLAAEDLVARVAAYQPAWSVSSAAQACALAALDDPTFLATTLPRLWAAATELRAGLRRLGLTVHAGALPMALARTGDGAATRAALLARGCAVRDCASFGLPAWVRVAPRTSAENSRLLNAWREMLAEGGRLS